MPKSDDPIEQARAQYQDDPENIVAGLVKQGLEEIPFVGVAIAYVRGKAREEKEKTFNDTVLDILQSHSVSIDEIREKLESENVGRVITVAVERIFWGASDQKLKRFAAVVANTIERGHEEQDFEDAASFIRALDELSEDDIRVLKHLYNHQKTIVVENHSMEYNSFYDAGKMGNMIRQATELGIQMDDFYARCGRLSGYGLVLPMERRQDSVGPSDFAFRITLLGKRLVEMLINVGKETTEVKKART